MKSGDKPAAAHFVCLTNSELFLHSIENIHYGLGLRLPKFFFDIGFEHSFYDSEVSPYTFADGTRPVAEIENKRFSAVITGGFKF